MSNSIELMLEALKSAEDYLVGSRQCAPLLNTVTLAIAAGEAELKSEPVAWQEVYDAVCTCYQDVDSENKDRPR